VINEINYASHPEKNTEDFIELYNHSDGPVDLRAWTIWDKSSGEHFEFTAKTILQAGDFIVVSRSLPDFKRFYPELRPLLGNLSFGIDNDGDGLALIDPKGSIHDIVDFLNVNPWPEEPNGSGATLELLNPRFDNSLAENWKASNNSVGTPGERNSQYEIVDGIEESISYELKVNAYPSPFSEALTLSLNLEKQEYLSIKAYSITGSMIQNIQQGEFSAGTHTISWTPEGGLASGLYLIQINTSSQSKTLKVVYR
jgi:hypothetical protein